MAPPFGLADALAECPDVVVAFALGRGEAGRGVEGTEVGLGVSLAVGVGRGVVAGVTEIVPPGAVVPSEPMNVMVQVPAVATRDDRVQVEPVAGRFSAMDKVAPPRVRRAMTEAGVGLPESTRKAKSVLVVPVRGLTDPLLRLRLARLGLTTAMSAMATTNKAIPELRAARRWEAHAVDAAAGKRVVPQEFVRGSLGARCRRPQ